MTDAPDAPRLAQTFDEVEDALLSRWPETKLEPSLDRILAFTELLGEPQRSFRSIHLTGTNGKTSTSRMIETLLRALDLRTGRFTSPHLERMSERISIDGEPLDDEAFVRAYNDVAPYTHLVDAEQDHPLRFFETIVGDGVRRVRRRPGRRRRGRGRDGRHAGTPPTSSTPTSPWCCRSPSTTPSTSATRRDDRGREGRDHQARRRRRAGRAAARGRPRCCCERAAEVGATVAREGMEFGVRRPRPRRRRPGDLAAGPRGRRTTTCSCRCTAPTRPRTPPWRWPRSRRSPATSSSTTTWSRGGVRRGDLARAGWRSSARSPTIVLDAAHNPHGAEAAAAALRGLVLVQPAGRGDGRDGGQGPRGPARRLRAVPRARRVHPELHPALHVGRRARPRRRRGLRRGPRQRRARPGRRDRPGRDAGRGGEAITVSIGAGAVLVTGSVVTVGEARSLLKGRR